MNSRYYFLLHFLIIFNLLACSQSNMTDKNKVTFQNDTTQYNQLTPDEEWVILKKGTERPFTGKYYKHNEKGVYTCKRCNAPLYRSTDKFESHCGWPSFDDEIPGAVERVPDTDGSRTEIICANCKGHLGHVFEGEGFTDKNIRHCVNSVSMNFIAGDTDVKRDTAVFASGCFWGTEYYFQQAKGVISTDVGYIGGTKNNPKYKEVSTGKTGHAEAVRVIFDPTKTTYEELVKLFFETHDPGQEDGQGPDIGNQYRSGIFYFNEEQKLVAEKLMKVLKDKGYKVVTELTKADKFWVAETYHQDYYKNSGGSPYCHIYKKKF
ncbi:MAG: bifunctional methionine sulfoxide reductase B/A protein [Cytophagaceae bacterium]|nr:bifunctional methionine sulfoxide reductase B/A protein [Cytophagaceae bacterium]